jgi:regulator of protease activity HflC (stomatin/prohibitin superfamily)
MNKFFKITAIVAALVSLQACTRIGTGEVGVRVDAYKQVQGTEILPGSMAQTIIGDVLTFPTRDIQVSLNNKMYQTGDNTKLSDFDITMVYSIDQGSVAELYSQKSKSFHATEKDGDVLLMATYIETSLNNASYKAVRAYKALEVGDKREALEKSILELVQEKLDEDGLSKAIKVTSIAIRSILPNEEILKSATEYVKAQNELRIKETEVAIAKKESERMAALASNSGQSIQYMNAQAQMKIAEGIAAGKVNTIVVPMDFKGMVNVK